MSDEKRVQQIRYAARYKYPDERIHFIDGAKWADSHPHWIPVEERKPQERGHYLVYSQYGDVWLSEWMQDKEGRWDWYVAPICVGIISKVTHWMPLPQSPRKEDKK